MAPFRANHEFVTSDGFVKNPYAALPLFLVPAAYIPVRLGPRGSGALPMELFTLPLEEVLL